MPLYKELPRQNKTPDSAVRLKGAAAQAVGRYFSLEGQSKWVTVLGCATPEILKAQSHLSSQEVATRWCDAHPAQHRPSPVAGWVIEEIRRKGLSSFAIIMDQHWLIQQEDGAMLCPSTPAGQSVEFLVCPPCANSLAPGERWNRAIYTNTRVSGSMGVAHPFVLTWAANWNQDLAYSGAKSHARFMPWSEMDVCDHLHSRGLDPLDLTNLAFCTDLDALSGALMIRPHPSQMNPEALTATLAAIRKLQKQGAFVTVEPS